MKKTISVGLLKKYLSGNCSSVEENQVIDWFNSFEGAPDKLSDLSATEQAALKEMLFSRVLDNINDYDFLNPVNKTLKIRNETIGNNSLSEVKIVKLWKRWAVAASVIFCLSFTTYLLFDSQPANKVPVAQNRIKTNDALPGGNNALLTLANGVKIVLNHSQNGTLAIQGGVVINKAKEGKIIYDHSIAKVTNPVLNNITTPRGGQYQVTLPDGTNVWLNSASSLTYPVAFAGNKREIKLSGEAYFEVAHDPNKPFKVISNGQIVEVLGTHFNINAYEDEPSVKTTLLLGSVKVSSNGNSSILKPGEQAQMTNKKIIVAEADLEEALAWKNGFFDFKDADVKSVMRQLSRWYDLDIKYEGQIPDKEFTGQISKNINASQFLHILSIIKIHYRIADKTIIITP